MGYVKEQVRARLATRADLEALRAEVARLGAGTGLKARVGKLAERVRGQAETLREQRSEVRRLAGQVTALRTDFERMAQQLAATETRIEDLRERVDPEVFDGTTEERAEARSLVEEVRREHEQIRIRFQVVSNYEERLSRVEEAVASDG